MKLIVILLIFYVFMIGKSVAYLDPGSSSIIFQAIIGFIAAGITALSFYWNKFKILIIKLFKKKKVNISNNLILNETVNVSYP